MGKLFTPQDVSSGFNTTNSLNTNFDNIETALDRTLSRYGETPNAMQATLDMNDNPIINAGAIDCSSITIDGEEIASVADLAAQVVLAQAAVTAAELAETNAEAAQAAAEAAAASINTPTLSPGDAGKILKVNGDEDGYDLVTPTAEASAATPSTLMVRDAGGRSQAATPSAGGDVANKTYVDGNIQYVLVASGISGSTVSLPTAFNGSFNNFIISWRGEEYSSSAPIVLQFTTDDGVSYETADYKYVGVGRDSNGSTLTANSSAGAHIQLTPGNSAAEYRGTITIQGSSSAAHFTTVGSIVPDDHAVLFDGAFYRFTGGTPTGFRLSTTDGNVVTCQVYRALVHVD